MGALERGGDRPAGPRGVQMGRMLGSFECFPFFHIGRRPVALTRVCIFKSDFSTPIRVSLIVVPDTISIVPSANGFNFLLIKRFVMISSIILDFSSVHENPPELESAIDLCCNINKVLSL